MKLSLATLALFSAAVSALPGSTYKSSSTYTVKVGGLIGDTAILKYDPPTVYADIGDTIVFDFLFRNHTVTESSFDKPCEKLDGGFASGFLPNLVCSSSFALAEKSTGC